MTSKLDSSMIPADGAKEAPHMGGLLTRDLVVNSCKPRKLFKEHADPSREFDRAPFYTSSCEEAVPFLGPTEHEMVDSSSSL